ncbi:hypothetical protein [Chelatococcus asaccharovorans]|uniref:Uncharacterized protein n=1 Tax=Chelatococcus asaccharovorans TaxID=28210 RepID=A0A2V3U755_9HYPH|nr:hypothetical protein [Chelatococcus asaccharovorans]MBS7705916.1 hypothetical protein [Chelatococcus asaccharovorans]PXW58937.1 hypothetical protein C7450_105286 [Chelatococcus asaccharovorans]
MVAREPSARTPQSEQRATGTDNTPSSNRHRLTLADAADDRTVAGESDQSPALGEAPPGRNAAAEPAPACHIVESVGGRALSRHLAPPVPPARIIFDLSALVEAAESARLIEACLRSTELTSVVLVDGPLARRFAGLLLNRIPDINVLYILNAGLCWQSGDWEALRDLVGFQRHDPDRLKLLTIDDALTGAVTALGGSALPCRLRPVSARRRPRMGRVALLIGRGTGETPSHGHVAAIAAIAVAEAGDRVGAILVPEEMAHLTALLKSFGLGKRLLPYLTVEDALARLAGTPVVYVAPFPDGVVDLEALVVLDQGGLVLVGPGAVPLPDAVADAMSSPYWEQADELGVMLGALVQGYHKQWAMLHDSIREASRAPAADRATASPLLMSPAA